MRKYLITFLLLCLHGLARGQTEGYNCYYWFDSQQCKPQISPVVQGSFDVDITALAEGIHTFHCLVAKGNGSISSPAIQYFVKTSEIDTTIKGVYWFDEEPDAREASVISGTFEVDASSLSDGFHRFYYMALQSNSTISVPSSCYFLKTAQVNPEDELTCICTVDGQLRHIEKLSQQGGVIHWNLDMQDLSDGLHQIQLQAVTPSGALTTSYNSYFMRVTSLQDLSEMYCVYAIDGNTLNSKSNIVSDGGSFHFDLDLSELEEGLHYISFMLYSDRGTSTEPQIRFFVKTPLGGNGITQYQYWLNDDEINEAKTVTLPEKVNPLQLMSLLPVESRPLRSSQFHFDIGSGKPLIYAKNTIHLRFYDIAKRFSDVAKEYTDNSISQEVEAIGELQATQTFPTIERNDIRWYTLQSAPGDTVAFKLSQPATIQLFAPSGAEVFKTSESASINWSGIHVWEDGTYYLAVHDVTGSKEEMTLDYMHMDKYDVVDWDVHTVGNGGCSTITFKGNGFRDLYAVDLVVAPGDTIHSVYISHDSDAETAVAFDFTAATLGDYNAVFHFTEEDKSIANVVTVEEAVDIELATEVSFPSSFLRGTSTTYTIKITNKGNMTAYNVPIYTYIQNKREDGIHSVKYDGLDLISFAETVSIDSISERDKKIIQSISDEVSDDWHFMRFKVVEENNPNDSLIVRSNLLTTNIQPNSTKILTLTIFCSEEVFAYITVPPDWKGLSYQHLSQRELKHEKAKLYNNCCYREGIECFADLIASRIDVASIAASIASLLGGQVEIALLAGLVDCAAGLGNTWLKSTGYIECGADDNYTAEELYSQAVNVEKSMIGTVMSCIGVFWGNISKVAGTAAGMSGATISNSGNYGEMLRSILWDCIIPGIPIGTIMSSIKCAKKFTEFKPGCPPNPDGGGGVSKSVTSLDPNDIYGYLSEAGSKFIADSVARVHYTIEFENDTTFAEAAAHKIVIKDTLDSRYFDLTKFMPTGVRIGGHEAFLDEAEVVTSNDETNFVKTIDMRPEINAIAQVDGEFNQKNGIAEWRFTSLDPLTMEPTNDLMQGILPVNYDGTSGIGEVMFEVGVKQGKADGTKVENRASIVFDYEKPILTPTWTNIVDAVPPTSTIGDMEIMNDTIIRVNVNGSDARSGVWKYELYVQHGQNAPWWKEGETYNTYFDFRFYNDIDYGFCVLATDSAGNVEMKELKRERKFNSNDEEFEDAIEGGAESVVNNKEEYDLSGRKAGLNAKGVIIRNRKKILSN